MHPVDGQPVRRSPRRLDPDVDCTPVLALLRAAFAYMDGVIDPPSSVHRLTAKAIAKQARTGEVWLIEDQRSPIACMFLTPDQGRLHICKLAVAEAFRGCGLARQLIALADGRARIRGLPTLELQTRVELTANHTAFAALGFCKTGVTAHAGHDRPTSLTFTRNLV